MSTLSRDLRFSFRALRQKPAVTVVAILTLGLAIGSTTAMFSVIDAVLLKPLNFDDPERVVMILESNPAAGLDEFSASGPNFVDWQAQNTVFSNISAYTEGPVTLTGIDGNADLSVGLSVLTGIVFGIVPALHFSRGALSETLKDAARGSSGGRERHVLRSVLVVAEIALTIVVAASAGLMMQSLASLHRVDPGFNADQVVTIQFNLPASRFQQPDRRIAFVEQMLERVRALPGVTQVGSTSQLPLTGAGTNLVYAVDGQVPADVQRWPNAVIRWVTPEFFDTLQIQILRGRKLASQDRMGSPPVIIVNDALARREFSGGDAVGKRMIVGGTNNKPSEIVGIVRNTQEVDLREAHRAVIYIPYFQNPNGSIRLAVRSQGDPGSLAAALRRELAALDKDIAVFNVRTMSEVAGLSLAQTRFSTTLLVVFAVVALLIAAVGVYGVMSYAVNQRTSEFGIRMALGAERRDVLKLVLRQALLLSVVGAVVGSAGALLLTRWLSDMLFEVQPSDPATLAGVAIFLMLVAIAASLLPARRATRVDPMVALRYE